MLAGLPNPDVRPLALFPWRSAMTRSLLSSFLSWTGLLCALAPAAAQTTTPALAALTGVVGDPRPDAPALSPRGSYAVGVRTLSLLNPGQLDVLQTPKDGALPRADRRLTVEVWYPAPGARGSGTVSYADTLGMRLLPTKLWGVVPEKELRLLRRPLAVFYGQKVLYGQARTYGVIDARPGRLRLEYSRRPWTPAWETAAFDA